MPDLESRPIQTKVKHEILRQYIRHWGFIITNGLSGVYVASQSQQKHLTSRFVYVDCLAYRGIYLAEEGQSVFGSPLIGVECMDKLAANFKDVNGISPDTNCIFVEENKTNFNMLIQTLEQQGYAKRIKQTTEFNTLKPGEIAVINADYTKHIDKIIAFTSRLYTWSLYFLDPYGPKPVPLDVVSRIIQQEHTDTIINLMYQDLHKKTGSASKDKPYPKHVPLLENWDAVYGGQEWRQIAKRYDSEEIDKEKMEEELVDLYKTVLRAVDSSLAVKRVPLKFEVQERTMFYLFLTTHDGTGALKMNEILQDAKISEYDYREKLKTSTQTSMFDVLPDPARPKQLESDASALALMIYQSCKNEVVTFKDILVRFADTPFYLDHLKKAMTKLKREKKCSYQELTHKAHITFR
jgi:three-Cys-motif partner protein